MKRVLVAYASKQGHVDAIVRHVVRGLEKRGLATRVVDLMQHSNEAGADDCDATIVAGSVHRGRGDPSLTGFVMRHGPAIRSHPSAFLSISLSAASHCSDEKAALDELAQHFLFDLGWQPDYVEQIAGAVLDKQLEILKSIASSFEPATEVAAAPNGGAASGKDDPLAALMSFSFEPTEPEPAAARSTAGEVTDWSVVDRFVERFACDLTGSQYATSAARR